MAQTTMYPAKAGSTQTTITAVLSDSATSIAVAELSAFPSVGTEGSNLVTFWDDNGWETCLYTAKSSASGAGTLTITRSGVGHDSSTGGGIEWPAGTKCARLFTAYDHAAVKANIEDHETRAVLADAHIASTSNPHLDPRENLIINGDFSVAQRGTSYTSATWRTNSDDSYLLDRWLLLSDGNDIVDVTQIEGAFSRSRYALQAEVETANKKFGFCQIFEANSCIPLRGQKISVSFAAKTVNAKAIENVRVAVLEWTGTADTVTSDVVSAWAVEGTNPTWATSWAALNTPANMALTTSEQTFKVENLTVGASCNNLAVFVWVDDTDCAVDDILQLGEVQAIRGVVVPDFKTLPFRSEYANCMAFFQKSYGYTVQPGSDRTSDYLGSAIHLACPPTSEYLGYRIALPIIMRTTPSMTGYDAAGAANKCSIYTTASGWLHGKTCQYSADAKWVSCHKSPETGVDAIFIRAWYSLEAEL